MKKYKIKYWLSRPDEWCKNGKWYKDFIVGSSNQKKIRTAKKAFKELENSPKGSVLIRFLNYVPGEGHIVEEWVKK